MKPFSLARLFALVALLFSLVVSTSAGAAPAPSPPPEPPPAADVRTGTTELATPEPSGLRSEEQPPGHAPRLGRDPKLPEAPPSFATWDGGWIKLSYPSAVRERVQPVIDEADRARDELSLLLGAGVLRKVSVRIGRTPAEMAMLAPEGAPYPSYAAGVAYGEIGLVLLTLTAVEAGQPHDPVEVFRHELAHVALFDAVQGRPVPRWFNEGFAVFASGESSLARLETLWMSTLSKRLIPLRQLERGFPADSQVAGIAYAEAADVVRHLLRHHERERFQSMLNRMRKGQTFEGALLDAYDTDLTRLEWEWRTEVEEKYSTWPVVFSGSIVWVATLGLFGAAYARKRRRDRATLTRWEHEEAAEDALRARREAEHRAAVTAASEERARVRIVLPSGAPVISNEMRAPVPDGDVPKVEHEGRWHTLH